MDCKNYKIDNIKILLNMCNDDFIISFANKGLLKRAYKEIDKGIDTQIKVIDDNLITVKFEDDITCTIKDNINDLICTCKSKGTCKHIIISILLLKKEFNDTKDINLDDSNNTNQINDINNIEYNESTENQLLKNININDIVNRLTEKEIKDILFRLNLNEKRNMDKNQYKLQVNIYGNLVISIPMLGNIDNLICSNKCQDFCCHKAEGLLISLIYENICTKDEVINKLVNLYKKNCVNEDNDILISIDNLMKKTLEIGLSRLPKSIINELEYEIHKCTKYNYPRIEKMLKSLLTTIHRYFDKDASFTSNKYIREIVKISLTIKAINNCNDYNILSDCIGVKKTSYTSINNITLYGIGACAWQSDSNYTGITYYFYDNNSDKLYSYNDIVPTNTRRSSNIKGLYNKSNLWGLESPMKSVAKCKVKLNNPQINTENRLSSSETTKAEVCGKTKISELNLTSILYTDFNELIYNIKNNFTFDIKKKRELENVVIIEVTKYNEPFYDEVNQQLKMDMEDIKGNILTMLIQYNKNTRRLISAIEKTYENNELGYRLLGKIYKFNGQYYISPITFYYKDNQMENITILLR